MRALPRLGTSSSSEPLPWLTSFGRTALKSEENSTSPFFRFTALPRSTMRWLCAFATGSEK